MPPPRHPLRCPLSLAFSLTLLSLSPAALSLSLWFWAGDKTSWEGKRVRDTSALESQRDDLHARLSQAHAQADAAAAQLREAQSKHWEEVKAMKDADATLMSEADSLANELQEKTNQLTEAKKEMIRMDQASKDEIGRLSHMAGLISAELEKRVNELTQITAERNALATEQATDRKKIETLEASLTSLEGTFKSTIQGDRERIKVRVRALHSLPPLSLKRS